jgi:hypothetical protein
VNESTQRRKERKGILFVKNKTMRSLQRHCSLMDEKKLKVDAREGVNEQGRYTFTRDYQRGN